MSTGVYVPATPSAADEIRRHTSAGVEAAMRDQLAALPSGKSGALVLYADQGGIRGALYGRKPAKLWGLVPAGEWTFVVVAGRTWQGQLSGTAAVGYSW
jgi:hypothetical protein